MADSTVTLVGTLGGDPELRYIASGAPVASFTMAVNKRYQKNGEWQEETSWFGVTAWSSLGENVAATLSKGDRVIVSGELKQRTWETNEGEKRSIVEVNASAVGPDLRWATAEVTRNERSDAPKKAARSKKELPEEEPF